jgi:thiosulfate dehydrogenase
MPRLLAAVTFLCAGPGVAQSPASHVASHAASHATSAWPSPPDPATLPAGPWKDLVLYGKRLITDTASVIGPEVANASMRYAGNNLACQNCHLKAGTKRFGLPLIGVYGAFPTYIAREDGISSLEDRINGCMERSMNGRVLPTDSKEVRAIVAYIQYVSTGTTVGKTIQGRGSAALKLLSRPANPQRGAAVFKEICAQCHQPDGQGKRRGTKGDARGYEFPPLWGPDSFNDGAGMHRLIVSASFVHANMPVGTTYDAPTLSVDDAWDVAAYINAQPRPARAHLERDYPNRARKPVDAPFPPFADSFPLQQHRLGPFKAIMAAQKH